MDESTFEFRNYLFGPYRLDPIRRTLLRNGVQVNLAPRLFDTLHCIVANHGKLLEKGELIAAVWGRRNVEEANLSQAVFALRKVLQTDSADGNIIITAPGRGYRCGVPVVLEAMATDCFAAGSADQPVAPEIGPSRGAQPWWRRPLSVSMAFALILLIVGAGMWRFLSKAERRPPTAAAVFAPPPHSVAVLAFTNLSGDPGQEYFSDGLSEELIGALGRVGELQVTGRTSAFFFKSNPATIDEIGRRLNVATILEGSVQRRGNALHITAQLIDVSTGYQIWSHRYDSDQGELLKVQADIASATAASLHVTLLASDVVALTLGGTANPRAMESYLRGEKLLRLATDTPGYRAALAAFDDALAQDPAFALAHSKRARVINDLADISAFPGGAATAKANADALQAADRAIALAPALGEAHASRGWVLSTGFLDVRGAVLEWERAHVLAPGDPDVESSYSKAETALGHKDRAIEAARHAVALDPLLPWAWARLAATLEAEHRYDAAIATLHYAKEVAGGSDADQALQLGRIALLKGDAATALRECSGYPGSGRRPCLAMAYHVLGRQAEAAAELRKLQAEWGDDGAYNYAQIYAVWGDTPAALDWLETAFRVRDPALSSLKYDQRLESIRNTQRYKDIERKMNFPS